MNRNYCVLIIFIAFSACNTSAKISKELPAVVIVQITNDTLQQADMHAATVESADSLLPAKHLLDVLNNNKIPFTTFSGKAKIEIDHNNTSDQVNATIRMHKDSAIWILLTGPLGIEGARFLITPDTVKVIKKIDKSYSIKSISYLQELFKIPLDFYGLQDLIIGNPVFIDSNIISYKQTTEGSTIEMNGSVFTNMLTVDKDQNIVYTKLSDKNAAGSRMSEMHYGNYEVNNAIKFPVFRKLSYTEKSTINVDLLFKQYEFNTPVTFPFTISKNYTQE